MTHTPTRGGLLRRHRDFRLLWIGETTGKFGTAVSSVAMPLIAVTELHAGTLTVGILTAAAWLPWLLIGLPAGVWVDRLPRRPVMLASAGTSLVLLTAVPTAAALGFLSLPLLLTTALLTGTAAVFFQTAYTAYLPTLLSPADQPEGNAKLHGSASAAQIAGLGTGGLLTQLAGAANALYANAATFLATVVALTRIRHREPAATGRRDSAAPRTTLTADVREGLRFLAHDRWLRTLTLFAAASNLALMGYTTVRVVFLTDTVGLTPGTVGLLVATTSAGGIAGAFLARRLATRIGTARATLAFELGLATPALLMPLTTSGPGVLLFALGGFSATAGVVAGNVVKAGFHQRYCPPRMLGRLTAGSAFLSYATIPLGALLGGALGDTLGTRTAMWITTAGIPLAALTTLCLPLRKTRDLPTRPPEHLLPHPTPDPAADPTPDPTPDPTGKLTP